MIPRLIFLVLAVCALGLLIYLQQPASTTPNAPAAAANGSEPGFVAIGAQIIQTGDDGHPLYDLTARRIAQPVPQGTIYLTDPVLHYQPPAANPWVVTAQEGQLPQSAHTADLRGDVQAAGKPSGSTRTMHLTTDSLHVDMQKQLATTPDVVHVRWAGSLLSGQGLRANLKSGEFELLENVHGSMAR